jgi:Stage II sporulation protein E (SpoIIE)
VAQSALLREVPATVAAGRLAMRYVSAAAETRVGGDLLEARDRAGRYFRLEDCLDTLRRTDLQAAADELLDRLLAHTGRRPDDDVAVLLFETASPPARPEDEPAAAPAPAGDTSPDGDPPAAAASGFLGRRWWRGWLP